MGKVNVGCHFKSQHKGRSGGGKPARRGDTAKRKVIKYFTGNALCIFAQRLDKLDVKIKTPRKLGVIINDVANEI